MTASRPRPVDIRLHQKSRQLEITFDDDQRFVMSCEYLRVFSPSAEVQGHGPGQEVLQLGKEKVNVSNIEQVGNYAIRLIFDDGHDSGIYSWDLLHDLGLNEERNFKDYLGRLEAAGHRRDGGPDDDAEGKGKVIRI